MMYPGLLYHFCAFNRKPFVIKLHMTSWIKKDLLTFDTTTEDRDVFQTPN